MTLPEPLHPILVHLPLTLAFLVPALALVVLVAVRQSVLAEAGWRLVIVLLVVLAGGAWAAEWSGEREEDRAAEVVSRSIIHEHEEAGERMKNASIATAILALGSLFLRRGRWAKALRWTIFAATLGIAFLGYEAGEHGGDLVWEHGAADAYRDR